MQKNTSAAVIALRYAVLTAIAFGAVPVFFRSLRLNQTTVSLGFLVLVLVTAYRWRLPYAVYLSILCTLLYNFFFLPPVRTFTVADPQNWIALGAFLFTSVLVSHLSSRARREAEASEARRRDIELLYRLSQKLLVQEDVKELARSAPAILASVFGFRAVALYVSATDTTFYSDPEQILVSAAALRSFQKEGRETLLERDGFKLIPLRMGVQHSLGQLAMADGETTTAMYEAIGSLVSVALERAATLERSNRLEAARESERLRSALVDSVTHDLRTPITAIRAAATTLLTQPEMAEAERTELITVVDEESDRLDRMVGQAVEMARLDSRSVQVNLAPQDVSELIEMTVEQIRERLRGHAVTVDVPGSLGRVRMDRTLMQRVLQHLLENAATYAPGQEAIEVSARLEEQRLVFIVRDHGPGIDREDLPFVFDKYYRGKRQKGQTKGTGMGLAIVQAIVKAHDGGISVESTPGQGAQFTFWIPVRA